MVSLNLTLFIQLGLFLIFLWGTHVFILKPVLRMRDERQKSVEDDFASAREANKKACEIEAEYSAEIASARRAVTTRIEEARRAAQSRRIQKLAERRAAADQEVEAVRKDALALAEQQRPACEQSVPELSRRMQERLGLGGSES